MSRLKKMNKIMIAFIFLCMFNLGCTSGDLSNCEFVKYGIEFQAKVGTKYCIDENNYIKIREVRNELCPCGVTCFWEGQYVLELEVMANGKNYNFSKGSSNKVPDTSEFKEFNINFVKILPVYNCTNVSQKDYTVTLTLVK